MVRNPENAQRHIIAFHMWSVVNFSEIVFHLYEVMNMHVYLKRVCHHRRFLWEDAVLHTEGGGEGGQRKIFTGILWYHRIDI